MNYTDFLIHSTIRIVTSTPACVCTGTGFFYAFFADEPGNQCIPVIVTNKHVIKGAKTGKLIFSLKNSNGNIIKGEYLDFELDDFENRWIMHPDDSIDLCILTLASIHIQLHKENLDLYYACLRKNDIPTEDEINNEFTEIENVTIVGYPDGIWDEINNIPITRKGITATPLQYNFKNSPKFLIDAAIYGGSSGSPVFIFDEGAYADKNNAIYYRKRMKLIGIVYAVALHTVSGNIDFVDIPTSKAPIAITQIPNNLGVVIKASKLFDFENILKSFPKS